MFRARICLDEPLRRAWLHAPEAVPGAKLRVMHFNVLADCLAKTAPIFGRKQGFRCSPEAVRWDQRRALLDGELTRHGCDIISLCEVDHYDDFFRPALAPRGYGGTFKRKRSPAKDGVAIFWQSHRLEAGLRRAIFLERGPWRTPGQQVAVLQRLNLRAGGDEASGNSSRNSGARGVVVCATHLRASANDKFRMQQAAEVISALADFSRGDEQIVLADINSDAADDSKSGGPPVSVLEYFQLCGYRCAYRTLSNSLRTGGGHAAPAQRFPEYTTWAGWASGDFRAVCDHIFVSGGIGVAAVLDVPRSESLAAAFPERLPNDAFPSDHMSLVADLVIP